MAKVDASDPNNKTNLISLYSSLVQLSIHYSNILNNHRILVFSVCTLLLAVSGNIAFNENTNNSLYLQSIPDIRRIAPFVILLFTKIVNFSIHQMLIVVHDKYKIVEDEMVALEKKLRNVHFAEKSKNYRSSQWRIIRAIKYYGTVHVIYLSCIVLAILIIVFRS